MYSVLTKLASCWSVDTFTFGTKASLRSVNFGRTCFALSEPGSISTTLSIHCAAYDTLNFVWAFVGYYPGKLPRRQIICVFESMCRLLSRGCRACARTSVQPGPIVPE